MKWPFKVLPSEMASSPERLDRFRREAKALEWFMGQVALVAGYGHRRREEEARAALAHLLVLRPNDDRDQCGADLRRFGMPDDVVQPLLDGLRLAGLT